MLLLDLIRSRVRLDSRFEVVSASPAAVLHGLALLARHQLSFWNAPIQQATRDCDSDCDRIPVLTDGMQAGAVITGVRVVNPFATTAAHALARAAARAARH